MILIKYLELGLVGAALSVIIQASTNFIIIYSIVHYWGIGKSPLHGFTRAALEGWRELFMQGVPTYFLQLFSFLSIDIVVLITAFVDVELVVANTGLVNIMYLFYLYVYAVLQSCSPMIGNKIGEGCKEGAQKLINANIIFGVLFTIFG